MQNKRSKNSSNFFPFRDIWMKIDFVKLSKLSKCYRNVYRKSSAKRECHDENYLR